MSATARRPRELIDYLPSRLTQVLAGLDGAPARVAEATVQLLPFGSRSALEATGLAVGRSLGGVRALTLTPLAYEVMSEAAERAKAVANGIDALEAQAREATRDLSAHSDLPYPS